MANESREKGHKPIWPSCPFAFVDPTGTRASMPTGSDGQTGTQTAAPAHADGWPGARRRLPRRRQMPAPAHADGCSGARNTTHEHALTNDDVCLILPGPKNCFARARVKRFGGRRDETILATAGGREKVGRG